MQDVTLYVGREIAKDNELSGKYGFQDAITPRAQTARNLALFPSLALVLVLAFTVAWYWSLVSLAAFFVVAIMARQAMPKQETHYLRAILNDLARREANYAKKNDHQRADAAREMSRMVGMYIARQRVAGNPI